MSREVNKRIIQRTMDEVFNAGDLATVDQLYAGDFVNHTSRSMGSEIRGPEGVKANVVLWHTAFPDLHFTVEAEVAEGDVVVSRWTVTGTHLGPLRGMPATGRRVAVSALEMSRIADGKIAEQWLCLDSLDLLHQLEGGARTVPQAGRAHYGFRLELTIGSTTPGPELTLPAFTVPVPPVVAPLAGVLGTRARVHYRHASCR